MRRETARATHGVPADALQRAPQDKWNSLQLLEHLMLSYTATTKGLLRTIESGKPEPSNRNLQHRIRSLYVLGLGRFPNGVESPKHIVPRGNMGDEPLRRFNDALVAMDATLCDAEKRFGPGTRLLNHPILGPLTAQQWRRFHHVHGRHHLRQIVARVNGSV